MKISIVFMILTSIFFGLLPNLFFDTYAGAPVKIILTAATPKIPADGISTSKVVATVADVNGNLSTSFTGNIYFSVSGGGNLIGTNPIAASGGIAINFFKSPTKTGISVINASSSGLITQGSCSFDFPCCAGAKYVQCEIEELYDPSKLIWGNDITRLIKKYKATNGESIQVWYIQDGLNNSHFEFWYYPQNADKQLLGYCRYPGGVNSIECKGPDNNDDNAADCIGFYLHTNDNYCEDIDDDEYFDFYQTRSIPCISLIEGHPYHKTRPTNCTYNSSTNRWCCPYPGLCNCTNVLAKASSNSATPSILSDHQLYDLNYNKKYDDSDLVLFNKYINKCYPDSLFDFRFDVNFDSCISPIDSFYIFSGTKLPPTSNKKYCHIFYKNQNAIQFICTNNILKFYLPMTPILRNVSLVSITGKLIHNFNLKNIRDNHFELSLSKMDLNATSQIMFIILSGDNFRYTKKFVYTK